MTLNAIIETLDDAPEDLREHYVERDGRFYLAVEGMEHDDDVRALKHAFEREREARREAKDALDALRESFDGIDPDAARTAGEEASRMSAERERLASELAGLRLDNAVHQAAQGAGIRREAIGDLLARASGLFELRDGAPVAVEDGEVRMGADALTPLSLSEWIEGLRADAPHLFQPSTGGGAPGSGAPNHARPTIDLAQPNAIGRNLEAVANGEAVVG